jgi:DNA-binding PadR family transcriptional regulator
MYPLVQRLAKKGYLSKQVGATGKPQKLDYSITNLGRTALEGWLLDAGRAAGTLPPVSLEILGPFKFMRVGGKPEKSGTRCWNLSVGNRQCFNYSTT